MPDEDDLNQTMGSKKLVLIVICLLTVAAVLPAIFHWHAHASAHGIGRSIRIALANLLALSICFVIYRVERRRLNVKNALALVFLIFLLTTLVNFLHKVIVDYGKNHFPTSTNLQWQVRMQDAAINLNPYALPHSYRFLPNSIVRWMEIGGLDFEASRNLYRLYAGLLLFYALFRFAELYTCDLGAVVSMLMTAVIFPVSFVHYAGQLTDPLSHLSFLLCFIFLQTEDFELFLLAMLVGALAKETVLAMAGYYVVFHRKEENYLPKSVIACVTALSVYFGVRLLVLGGHMGYRQISGPAFSHVFENWNLVEWRWLFLLTGGALLPFLLLGWKTTPRHLKQLTFYLLPVLLISSLFFSWLVEVRNFMPLVFVLSVVTGKFLAEKLAAPET